MDPIFSSVATPVTTPTPVPSMKNAEKYPALSSEFISGVKTISKELGANPLHLMAAMSFETGGTFLPNVKNPVSSGTGLIQFMKNTAIGLGSSIEKLREMTREDQLQYVFKHFLPAKGKIQTLEDLYMQILCPAAVGASKQSEIFNTDSTGKCDHSSGAYRSNQGLDLNADGSITKSEAVSKLWKHLERVTEKYGKYFTE
ncbi:lytic transglycosylase [bacterium]|nr:lytic transglycosylase [bacterium]